jgi:hypothetical protein
MTANVVLCGPGIPQLPALVTAYSDIPMNGLTNANQCKTQYQTDWQSESLNWMNGAEHFTDSIARRISVGLSCSRGQRRSQVNFQLQGSFCNMKISSGIQERNNSAHKVSLELCLQFCCQAIGILPRTVRPPAHMHRILSQHGFRFAT